MHQAGGRGGTDFVDEAGDVNIVQREKKKKGESSWCKGCWSEGIPDLQYFVGGQFLDNEPKEMGPGQNGGRAGIRRDRQHHQGGQALAPKSWVDRWSSKAGQFWVIPS